MLWLTLNDSSYPCLEQISMIPKMFEPLKFSCIFNLDLRLFSSVISKCPIALNTCVVPPKPSLLGQRKANILINFFWCACWSESAPFPFELMCRFKSSIACSSPVSTRSFFLENSVIRRFWTVLHIYMQCRLDRRCSSSQWLSPMGQAYKGEVI